MVLCCTTSQTFIHKPQDVSNLPIGSFIMSNFLGKSGARYVALNAIQSLLLHIGIETARGIVWNITRRTDMALFEV